MSEPVDRARSALTEAPVDRLVDAVADVLAGSYGITAVELLQVDYRLAALVPLGPEEPVTSPATPRGAASTTRSRCGTGTPPTSR